MVVNTRSMVLHEASAFDLTVSQAVTRNLLDGTVLRRGYTRDALVKTSRRMSPVVASVDSIDLASLDLTAKLPPSHSHSHSRSHTSSLSDHDLRDDAAPLPPDPDGEMMPKSDTEPSSSSHDSAIAMSTGSEPSLRPGAYPIWLPRLDLGRMFVRRARAREVDEAEGIYGRSSIWLAATARKQDHIMTIVQNIPYIRSFEVMQRITPSGVFAQLLLRFSSSLIRARHDRSPDLMVDVVAMAKAVVHVALADPGRSADALCRVFDDVGSLGWLADMCEPSSEDSEELMILLISIFSLSRWTQSYKALESLLSAARDLRAVLHRSSRKGEAATTYLHHSILVASLSAQSWEDTFRQLEDISQTLLFGGEAKVDAAYVSCASRALSATLSASASLPAQPLFTSGSPLEVAKSAWAARHEWVSSSHVPV